MMSSKKYLKNIIVVTIIGLGILTLQNQSLAQENLFFTKTLQLGSKGEEVKNLQALLRLLPETYPEGLVSGYFGQLTEKAVMKFQAKYGISPAGFTGPKTRKQLNEISRRLSSVSQMSDQKTTDAKEKSAPPIPTPPNTNPTPSASSGTTASTNLSTPYFSFSWRATSTLTGEINLPTPAPKPIVILDGQKIEILKTSAAVRLAQAYNIFLVDKEEKWNEFRAGMLLNMIERLPTDQLKRGDERPWRATLTNKPLSADVADDFNREVRFNTAVFTNSNPTLQPSISNNPDRVFYSNRLFKAVLRAFYNDEYLLKEIIKKRYGPEIGFADPIDEFQNFTLEELQYIAAVFEDLPTGFRHIPGFTKIVRRKTGLSNPYHPGAPAIAWTSLGYIEFMDIAFTSANAEYIQRLVAHEVSHFLWDKVLTKETQRKFMDLSGWEELAHDVWVHQKTTNFVSDYAASDPLEDFAETISYYIYNPDMPRTVAPDKYDFIKNVIDGYEYVTLVDKQFTFQVFNLEPDLTFPGKIIGVDTKTYKLENGGNKVIATLHLSPKHGDGAENASTRIFSPAGTWIDVWFNPVNNDKFQLRAEFTINKFAANGYWAPAQITVRDRVDNRRQEGQSNFSWLLYINNPDEDLEAPQINIFDIRSELMKVDDENIIKVTVPITDKNEESLGGQASVVNYESEQQDGVYATYDKEEKKLIFLFHIRKYRATGNWVFREVNVYDAAGNSRRTDLKTLAHTIYVSTLRPDYVKPELDISTIKIEAKPRKPQSPDGETDVTIWYKAKDNNAGLGFVTYNILKPDSGTLFDYHYHDNFYTDYFVGNPSEWKLYEIKLTLPPGSIPGTWILREIDLSDKAGNKLTSNFVETGIVRPFKVY